MYRISPAEVSKAEAELIRLESCVASVEAELEKKQLEATELLHGLADAFDASNAEQLEIVAADEEKLQAEYYELLSKMQEARKRWRQMFIALLKKEKDLQGISKFADTAKNSSEITSRIARLTGGRAEAAEDANPMSPRRGVEEDNDSFGAFEISAKDVAISVDKKLGEGAFGIVYLGLCRGKQVAVKELRNLKFDPKIVDDFRRECLIMRSLPHENILLFMGACLGPDRYLLVSELADNKSLEAVLKNSKLKLSFIRKMKMAREIAEGVNWLHCQNPPLIHLDLKPANVLVMDDWSVKIADFGMSRLKQAAGKDSEEGSKGIGGTPLYMPPELFGANPVPTEKCDVYAYGVVLFELITEMSPYAGRFRSIPALIKAVVQDGERPDVPLNTPPSLATLMKSCWDMAPVMRPSLATVLQQDPFNVAITEAVAEGETKVKKLWESFGKGADGNAKQSVPWLEFQAAFAKMLNVDTGAKEREMKAVEAILDCEERKGQVTIGDFKRFLSFFKPLRSGGSREPSTVDEVAALVKESWFWGTLDANAAQRALQAAKAGSYLIRFSGSVEGQFSLSYVAKDPKNKSKTHVIHMRLEKAVNESIQQAVKRVNKKIKVLKTPLAGRPAKYEMIFASKVSFNNTAYGTDFSGDGDDGTDGDTSVGAWNEYAELVY